MRHVSCCNLNVKHINATVLVHYVTEFLIFLKPFMVRIQLYAELATEFAISIYIYVTLADGCWCLQVVEDGYEFFAKRQLVTLFSAPNYCGEFDNAGGMMSVDETLMCSFQVSSSLSFCLPRSP